MLNPPTNRLELHVASGDALDVRRFEVTEGMNELFRVTVRAVSQNLDLDFDAILGLDASFTLGTLASTKTWRGLCVEADQVRVDREGLATYELVLAPRAHRMTLRKNYRIFQYQSELDIAVSLLGEWGIAHRVAVDGAAHKPRKLRTQYGETDFGFLSRMLEDAGISFSFEDDGGETVLVLDDAPHVRPLATSPLRFFDSPGVADVDFATKVEIVQRVRPGKISTGDLDYRRAPTNQPRISASGGLPQETALEQFHYEPGTFLYQGAGGGSTPTADDRGAARTDESTGARKVEAHLRGHRADGLRVRLESNVLTLSPGVVFGVAGHPHGVAASEELLVVKARLAGEHASDWRVAVEAAPTSEPFNPPRRTPRPKVAGLEGATVVGASADEIHTDEYARVRVHFHWDRESGRDEKSSCWVPTNQPWAGAGFGGTVLPRVGQEVLVEFLNGDPDRPVVLGRVFTEHQPPPYPLPEGKTLSGLVGRTTPALVAGGSLRSPQEGWVYTSEMNGRPVRMGQGRPMEQFRATRPRPLPPSNRDNAFLLGDEQNQNLVFLQARRDLNILAKNSWRSVVGNYRGTLIYGNDDLHVRNKQHVNVLANQKLHVEQDQDIKVAKERTEDILKAFFQVVREGATVLSKGVIEEKAKESIVLEAQERIGFRVGDSIIVMDEEAILIDSPKVDINP
jgi:type VI secretion system secreted protein VgrG